MNCENHPGVRATHARRREGGIALVHLCCKCWASEGRMPSKFHKECA